GAHRPLRPDRGGARMTRVTILAPHDGAELSSPLAILRVRYEDARGRTATLHVGDVVHVVELADNAGEIRENITLVQGPARLSAETDGVRAEVGVTLRASRNITLTEPGGAAITTRATGVVGAYKDVSCPAGVIAVNGFMQQFAVRGGSGAIDEKIVLRP